MIALTGVNKTYPGQKSGVLEHVHLKIGRGEFLYVVGGSGAGKSSLLRMLATEEAPTSGKISLFGYELDAVSPTALRAIRQTLGYIPQDVRLIPDLTVFDNIAMSLSLAGRRSLPTQATTKINELLEKLGLSSRSGKLAGTLSGGEAQRVAVARALVRSPDLIVADEPTGAQDRDFTWLMMDLFLKANLAGATVVIATHDPEIVRRVRKRCAVLKGGRIQLEEALCIF